MKKLLTTLCFCAMMTLTAHAQMEVDSIVLNQNRDWPQGKAPSIRVNMHNPGTKDVYANTVELQIRESSLQSWRTIQTWKLDQGKSQGQRLTLGYQPNRDPDPLLLKNHFQLQAVVNGVAGPVTNYDRKDSSANR